MKKLMIAVAMTIALPAAAFAQNVPAKPAQSQGQTCQNQTMDHSKMSGMDNSKMAGMDNSKMAGMDNSKMAGMDHSKMAGMDHSKMAAAQGCGDAAKAGAKAPADPHAGHKQ